MAPQTEQCLTCLKKFAKTDMAVQLTCLDTSNNVTVQNKLKACIPEVVNCTDEDELCTTCNYMLGICFKFRMTCLKSQDMLARDPSRRPAVDMQQNNPFSIHLKISNQKSTPVPNCEFSFSTAEPVPAKGLSSPHKSIVVKNNDSLGIVQTAQSKSGYVICLGQNDPSQPAKVGDRPPQSGETSAGDKCYVRTQNGFVPIKEVPAKTAQPPKYNLTLEQLLTNSPSSSGKANSSGDDRIAAIETDPSLSDQDRNRLLVEEILKCNSHLNEYSAEQFECHVQLEPLPKFYVPKNQNDDKTGYLCQCNHCGLTFTSKVKLLSHIRRHFKYKPHKCSICERRYYEVDDLKMHMMAHKVNDQKKLAQPAVVSTPPPPAPPPPPPPATEPTERVGKAKFNMHLLKEVPPSKLPKLDETPPQKQEPVMSKLESVIRRNFRPIAPAPILPPQPPPLTPLEPTTYSPDPLHLIPAINIKTESIFEELNTAPSVSKPPKVVKKPPVSMPKKPPTTPYSRNDSVDFLEKYITNLRCRFCNIMFQTDAETAQHSKLHCNICFELCSYPDAHINYHTVLLNKNKKKIYLCLVCGTHNPRGHFIMHNKVHDIICEICSMSFTNDKLFQHHRQSCPEYHCKYCGKTFPTLSHGRTHEYHTHEKQYRLDMRCPQCKKQFPAIKHLKSHSCKKCDGCGEFVDTKQVSNHFCTEQPLMEQEFDPFAQTLMDPLLEPLVQPMYVQPEQTVQQEEPEDSKANIPLLIPLPAQGQIVCEVCSKSYDNKAMFDVHECYDDQGVRIYRCEICTGYFSRLEFIDHMKVHIS